MNAEAQEVTDLAINVLARDTEPITETKLATVVDRFLIIYPIAIPERQDIINALRYNFSVNLDNYQILEDKEDKPEPWIAQKRASGELKWNFWLRYHRFQSAKLATPTLNQLDNLTNEILDRLMDPKIPGPWDRRGMVVGQVQSGKTGNYIGLVNKAADAGYKLIIVLAGLHDNLRTQTQIRIDEGFLGFNTQSTMSFAKASNRIGVGKFNKNLAANALTTSLGDFNKSAAQSSGNTIHGTDPIVLVVKKNPSILKNLIKWLAVRGETRDGKKLIEDVPMLLIDDEADNASINTSKDKISTINGLIRSLLSLFNQSAYVGYTATPFANIFIPIVPEALVKGLNLKITNFEYTVGQDIFPRDFIINIPAPSNYIGPTKIFGLPTVASSEQTEEPLPVVVNLDDPSRFDSDYNHVVPDKHKKNDPLPDYIPASIIYAIKCFVLVCAARYVRGQEKQHNSMLIHISRFVPWIDRIALLVDNVLKNLQNQIEFNTGSLWEELEEIWERDFILTSEVIKQTMNADPNGFKDLGVGKLAWKTVKEHLFTTIMKIEVRAVHGQTKTTGLSYHNIKPLDYFEAEQESPPRYLSVIAVGGDKLSRGLTLEGLSISYYLRASKMYDTLMQMGRWFGYRPGYIDLCRLFTSAELISWYRHITIASEEMREEFDRMYMLGRTPREFGLKVRTHPGALIITALNKFREAREMALSYSAELKQTHRMKIDERIFQNNLNAVERLLPQLGSTITPVNKPSAARSNYVWQTNSYLVCQFLNEYRVSSAVVDIPKIIDYIEKQNVRGDLINWTIALMNNSTAQPADQWPFSINNKSERIGLTSRSNASRDWQNYYDIAKAQIISPSSGDEYIDLTDSQLANANLQTADDWQKKEKKTKPKYPSTFRIKYNRPPSQGLLLIYPLNPSAEVSSVTVDPKLQQTLSSVPIIGLAISFPNIEHDEKVIYAVNQQFVMDYDYDDTLPEMDDE